MPIYEYRCKNCGKVEEFLVLGEEQAPTACPSCGAPHMERIMSPAAFLGESPGHGPGRTCCGREERCSTPPCSGGGGCRRDL